MPFIKFCVGYHTWLYLVSIFRLLKKKMAVVIIPIEVATWEAILLHTLETQRKTRD